MSATREKCSDAWEAKCEALTTALRRYGRHEDGCGYYDGGWERETPCTCGLTAALAGAEKT